MNSVKLYSNGTAVISREYQFQEMEALRVSIPVRKTDLDDVISSLSVFGDASVTVPPTYTPANAQETELTLKPVSILEELATKLAGAAVEIDAGTRFVGKLMGMHRYRQETHGTIVERCRIIVLTDKGVQQIEDTSVTAIRFTDSIIQSAINKALAASLSEIRPDSSVVELTIQPNAGATSACVTYAIPVAAWKIRYQLRLTATGTELEGQAVVDNDTDDDWTDTLITVITGEPITFSTDLAEIRRPARSKVNIVPTHTTGAVTAEEEMFDAYEEIEYGGTLSAPAAAAGPDAKMSRNRSYLQRADQVQAEVRESGDFSMFESPHAVTIAARKSAIIPLFRTGIHEASSILFYKEKDDAQRPFRGVRLRNQTSHSLGRGICEVFIDGEFQGKSIFESTKVGDEVTLIHAKETGVRVFKESSRPESRRMAIKISDGNVYCEQLNRLETTYRVQNNHPTAFSLEIEHPRTWQDSQLAIHVSGGSHKDVRIPSGQRILVNLEAKGVLSVKVSEEQIVKQSLVLVAEWLQQNVIELNAPISNDLGVQKCIAIREQIDLLEAELTQQSKAAKTLDEEQKRLMKLIPNAHNDQANEWRNDLAIAERELREIKRTAIPALQTQLRALRSELHEALRSLQYNWAGN